MKTLSIILLLFLTAFNEKSCLKMDILLLVDMSGSVQGYEEFVKEATESFVRQFNLSENGIRMGIIKFAGKASIISSLTSDKEELEYRLVLFKDERAYGTTNMLQALEIGLNEFLENDRGVRKLIIIITDGSPTSDEQRTKMIAEQIKNLGIGICGVLISSYEADEEYLQEISSNCYVRTDYYNLINELKNLEICL
jgi:Mg-chelatase subunit ChlD